MINIIIIITIIIIIIIHSLIQNISPFLIGSNPPANQFFFTSYRWPNLEEVRVIRFNYVNGTGYR